MGVAWTSQRKRGLMEKALAPGVPSWVLPGPLAPFYKNLPQCLPAASWRIETMSSSIHPSSEPKQGLSPHRCPESCIYRIDPHRSGGAALNLESGRLMALVSPSGKSFLAPPTLRGKVSPASPRPCTDIAGGDRPCCVPRPGPRPHQAQNSICCRIPGLEIMRQIAPHR